MMKPTRYSYVALVLVLLPLTLYRILVLFNLPFDLYADEAYYWGWSQHFAFGYYSKPPMVAWLIALGTSICGEAEACIKLLSPIVYFATSSVIYLITLELFDKKSAFYAGFAFATVPAVWLSSILISTDVPFLFFWSLSLYLFILALKSDRWLHWLSAGIFAGCGLLSKYTMIMFLVSAVLYLSISAERRKQFRNRKFYTAMLAAFAVYLPNLLWNVNNHFASFLHTRDNAHLEGQLLHPGKMAEFVGSQFGVFGPVLFGWLLVILFRYRRYESESFKMLWWFVVPFFTLIVMISFLSRAHANWSAPMYVGAIILVTAWLVRHDYRRWLCWGLAVNIFFGVLVYHYHDVTRLLGVELTAKTDPYKRVMGWKALGEKVGNVLRQYPDAILLCNDRKTLAELIYYIRPHPFNALKWNPNHTILDHYELTTDLNDHIGKNMLFVTTKKINERVQAAFERVTPIGRIDIPLYRNYARGFDLYYLEGFKGY